MDSDDAPPDSTGPTKGEEPLDARRLPVSRDRREVVESLSETAAELGGTGAGIAAASVFGPWAVVLGPMATAAIKQIFRRGADRVFVDARSEWIARQLGPREQRRAAAAYDAAIRGLARRLDSGQELRDDGFFPDGDSDAAESPASAALEGVLVKARDAYDRYKAERLGELWAWLAVQPNIAPAHAN